jgi:2-C-methyl-D-erythritol 4-phosphate cytidylyltransferase
MKKYAVIVAGGSGQRMGAAMPKQFLLLQQKPLLWYSLQTFLQAFDDLQIILVLPKENITEGEKIAKDLGCRKEDHDHRRWCNPFSFGTKRVGFGRIASVVFVHDGVRCLVSKELIHRCYEQAIEKGSAVPAVAATDSIRIANGTDHTVADRNHVRIIQTPQTFLSAYFFLHSIQTTRIHLPMKQQL